MSGFEVWLARHGETEWSLAKRHTGRTDIPLTNHGKEQARALAPTLAEQHFSRVFASPLLRARQTCEGAGLIDRAELRDELVEWDYGDYEGKTTAEIQTEMQPGWLLWTDGCPGGEMPADVGARVDPLIEELRGLDGDAIVFAHGHVLRVFAARWIEQEPIAGQRIALATGTLSRLGLEHDYPVIRAWNAPV
ncbi:MAG: histidine phosphatase family protein [Thermoleophilia bacterium]|jgi:broad specificity phosphatase PhoE|nr:histidine phosphatase family protein [Thermoleophilia bacterium]